MKNPICWFEIYVEDLPRAKAFYETMLAISLGTQPPPSEDMQMEMATFPGDFESYGASGALVLMPDMKPGSGGSIVYFSCEDCAVEESRVAAAGGRVIQSKMSIGEYGFCTMVSDTEGNTIGLHSMR